MHMPKNERYRFFQHLHLCPDEGKFRAMERYQVIAIDFQVCLGQQKNLKKILIYSKWLNLL